MNLRFVDLIIIATNSLIKVVISSEAILYVMM